MPSANLKVEYLPLTDLLPYARNARTHTDEQVAQIAASIREFGFTNPILISEGADIIAGHGRALAAAKLQLEQVPCIRLGHLSETQRKAYVIADNRLALNAGWDTGMLSLELLDLKADEFDLNLLGFESLELKALLEPEQVPSEGLTDPDAVPENAPTRCKPGDLWQLGKHRLLCGDSTSADVARLFGDDRAALCFTSPPYADQREYGGGKELSTEHLATFIRAADGMVDLFAVNLGLSRKGGEVNQYWDDYIKEAKACGLKLLSWNVWDRGAPCSLAQQTAMFAIEHEWVLVFGESIGELNKTVLNKTAGQVSKSSNRDIDGRMIVRPSFDHDKRVHETYSHRRLGTVCRIDIHRGESSHPAMFPVALPEAYIEACTDSGDAVYEPFAGSGTTLIACEKTGRRCFAMEIDAHYCDVILERWEKFTGKTAELLDGST